MLSHRFNLAQRTEAIVTELARNRSTELRLGYAVQGFAGDIDGLPSYRIRVRNHAIATRFAETRSALGLAMNRNCVRKCHLHCFSAFRRNDNRVNYSK